MTVFATALAALHADPNMGEDAFFRRPPFDWQAVRAIRAMPAEELAGLGGPGARGKALTVSIIASAIAEVPRKGDEVQLSGTAWRVESSDPDTLGLSYTLTLARI